MRGIIEGFRKELHHAIRRIARSPGFCIVVVLLIAIGIGTATTIFALLDALLLRPLPVKDPGTLVQVVQLFPNLRAQGYFPLEMYRRLTGGSSTLFDVAFDPGFDKQHVATFSVDPRLVNYDSREIWLLQQRLLRETQSITGIEAAAISGMPLLRGIGTITGITLPGQGQQLTNVNFVTPEYFDLMKMRVVVGRLFQSTDKAGAKPEPVVVNEEFVRRFLQGRQAVGVRLGREGNREIVGVVNDSYYRSLRENPPPILYVSDFGPNAYPRPFVLYIRTRYAPETMIEPIRRVLQSVDPKVPIYEATTISAEIERSLWRERLVGKLAIWFGTFALLLSAIALYGALAYYITQRRREFGLRLALGASARHVIETVLRRISAVMISGLAAGFGVYFITARWLKILFFGVRLRDPISIIVAVVLLIATAAAAAGLPIYRVLQLDPASVLKQE
jgi:MacB-like periplasmic core domain